MKRESSHETTSIDEISLRILKEVLLYRRRLPSSLSAKDEEDKIIEVQLPVIKRFVEKKHTVQFVLPAFPSKSPNPSKVLGKRPDMGERLSLLFLNSLCQRIQIYYPPGAHIKICSDGHVFGDLIRVSDEDINIYQQDIEGIFNEIGAKHLSLFNLSDVEEMARHLSDYDQLRRKLVEKYAVPEEEIKQQLTANEEGLQLYRAIIRFMYEDSFTPDYNGSNAALQKDAKQRACRVIQRSWAWGNLLEKIFPCAVRLSIHPQPAESLKIGVHMLPTLDNWLTPWHAVAVKTNDRFVLMKRKDVEELGGKVVKINGVPSHYEINSPESA